MSATRARIRSTNASYGVRRSASSKCWTTVTATPAASSRSSRSSGSSRSAGAVPIRTSSGWWSKVMTVGRAPRAVDSGDEVLEQVGMPEMHPVEDADDDEDRAELRPELVDPVDDVHRRPQPTGTAGDPAGATKTLSGASRPAAAEAIATSVPAGSRQAVVLGGPGQATGRAHELAARDRRDLVGRQRHDREGVEADVDRPEERQEAGRSVGRRRPDVVERRGVGERERPRRGPGQGAEIGGAADRLAEVAGERPDVGPGRACDVEDARSAGPGRCRPTTRGRGRGS